MRDRLLLLYLTALAALLGAVDLVLLVLLWPFLAEPLSVAAGIVTALVAVVALARPARPDTRGRGDHQHQAGGGTGDRKDVG